MQARIEWIDIAKGIGMFLVIAGHTVSLHYCYPLYAFHMPLFFFLSGLVFIDKNERFDAFALSKARSLLKPWIAILFFSFLVCLSIPQWRNELTVEGVLADFYTANTNTLQNSSLWYLVCFYIVLLLSFLTNKIRKTSVKLFLLVMLSLGVLYIREFLSLSPLPFHRLPFKIDSALVALVFFMIAYCYKSKFVFMVQKMPNVFFILPFVILTAVLSVYNGWSNINSLDFGRIRWLYYPIAFLGIGTVCLISKCMTKLPPPLKNFWIFYGKNSLLIFGFQSLFIRLYLLFFNYIEGLDMRLYGDNPIIHQIGSLVIVFFVISPLNVRVIDFLKANIKKL